MDLELEGKNAIVTGGSKGIGKAIARELANEGVNIVIAARNKDLLNATAKELSKETNQRIIPVICDTGSSEAVTKMVNIAIENLNSIDILVNCAARPLGQSIEPLPSQTPDDHFWNDMNTKVLGYLRCIREVVPYMKTKKWGRIINIGGLGSRSVGSTVGSIRNTAVVSMTKNLANELGQYGINVSAVHPGLTKTEAIEKKIEQEAIEKNISIQKIEEQMSSINPLGKIITPLEIAHVVLFLASPKSISITGDVITAGGGAGSAIYY